MELNRAVAENIKRIRKSKKLSMERLAAESGVSRSMLGQIERGEANPSVGILGKLAAALKVPAEVLLENDDFQSLMHYKECETKPIRMDAGKVVVRPNFPYDDVTRLESCLGARLRVPPDGDGRRPGCDGGGGDLPAGGAGCPAFRGRPSL